MFKCSTCDVIYTSYQSLLKHSRKKKHFIQPSTADCSSSNKNKDKMPIFPFNINSKNLAAKSLIQKKTETNFNISQNLENPRSMTASQQFNAPDDSHSGCQLFFVSGINLLANQPFVILAPANQNRWTRFFYLLKYSKIYLYFEISKVLRSCLSDDES